MCHLDRVAKKCYLREDLTCVAASAMNIIHMCTLAGDSNPNPNIKAKTTSVECVVKTSSTCQSSDSGHSVVELNDDNMKTDEVITSPEAVNLAEKEVSHNLSHMSLQYKEAPILNQTSKPKPPLLNVL